MCCCSRPLIYAVDYAGQGPFLLSPDCWTCYGRSCNFTGDVATFGPTNGVNVTAAARVSVPGGGKYRLIYRLKNFSPTGSRNNWQAIIRPIIDKQFNPFFMDPLNNMSSFNWTDRPEPGPGPDLSENIFKLPPATTVFNLTFEARQVWSPLGVEQFALNRQDMRWHPINQRCRTMPSMFDPF